MQLCIVGGGIMGLMSAYQAVTKFRSQITTVHLIDSGKPGSSVGELRAIQNCYQGIYGKAVRESRNQWSEFLTQTDPNNYLQVGNLLIDQDQYIVPEDSSYRLGGPDDRPTIFDIDAGLFTIQQIHQILETLLVQHGVQCHWQSEVVQIEPTRKKLRYRPVGSSKSPRTLQFDHCILATGAWTNQVLHRSSLSPIPYRITLEQINMFHLSPAGVATARPAHNVSGDYRDSFCYMYPPIQTENFSSDYYEVVVHLHPKISTDITVEQLAQTETRTDLLELATGFLEQYVDPTTQPEITQITTTRCPYTHRNDGSGNDFIVSPHPDHGNLTVMVGYRGEGYKFSPVLAELALYQATQTDWTELPAWWRLLNETLAV